VNWKQWILSVAENEWVVTIIDAFKGAEIKRQELPKPEFYRPMPSNFYSDEPGTPWDPNGMQRRFQRWKTEYSAIIGVILVQDSLYIQVRTCGGSHPFAIVEYGLPGFRCKGIDLTGDLMLANQGDQVYFLKGGQPGMDDEAGELTIIRRRVQTK
jgi:hypothetical protein